MARQVIILFLTVLVAAVTGCGGAHRYDGRLVQADSLMQANPDSALAIVEAVNADSLSSQGDRAYRDLLLTQARYKCYVTATSDSDINRALNYYRQHDDEREKLTRAYIYKGAVMQELNHPDSAMYYYKTAEATAAPDDYFNRGFCNLRIGELYQYHFSSADSVVKACMRKAMNCFIECRDTNYIIKSMGGLGSYMNQTSKDSAIVLLKRAILLARDIHSSDLYFYQSKLAGVYFYLQDYPKAKELAIDIIYNGKDSCDEKTFYYYAARSFIRLGQLDSARWVTSLIPAPVLPIDSFNHYLLQAELAEARHDNQNNNKYSANAENIHRRILENSSNPVLLIRDLKHDATHQQERLEKKHNKRTLMIVGGVSLLLIIVLLMARSRFCYREKLFQQELDLAQQKIKRMIDKSEKQISELLAERKKDKAQLKLFNKELSLANKNCRHLEQKDQNIHERASAIVRARNAALNELYDDIRIVIKSDSEDDSRKSISLSSMIKDFSENRKIRLLSPKESFWKKLKTAVDLEFDGIATFVEKNYPQLSIREQHLFCLICADVPSQIIKLCMNYTSAVTVSNNKKRLMRNKIGMDIRVDEFITMYLNGELEIDRQK